MTFARRRAPARSASSPDPEASQALAPDLSTEKLTFASCLCNSYKDETANRANLALADGSDAFNETRHSIIIVVVILQVLLLPQLLLYFVCLRCIFPSIPVGGRDLDVFGI